MTNKKPIVPEKVKSRPITNTQRTDAARRIYQGIISSPLLTLLGVYTVQRGSHFHLDFDYNEQAVPLARLTPMQSSPAFALESQSDAGWELYGQGTPNRLIKLLCNDTLGTFHALGSIDQTLRNAMGKPPQIVQNTSRTFIHKSSGLPCSLQEALYFYFGIPLVIVMEPREFYRRHAAPSLLETNDDDSRILVRFCSRDPSKPSILGYGYYTLRDGNWYGVGIPAEAANTLEEAEKHFTSMYYH